MHKANAMSEQSNIVINIQQKIDHDEELFQNFIFLVFTLI